MKDAQAFDNTAIDETDREKPDAKPAAPPASVTVQTRNGPNGPYLTDGQGNSLYLFVADTSSTSTCNDACATQWPPLVTQGAVVAGSGVDAAKLSTSNRPVHQPRALRLSDPATKARFFCCCRSSIGTENWNKVVIRRVSSWLSGRICGVIRRVPLELNV